MFHSLVGKASEVMERDIDDLGVTFRAVLAIFHLELGRIHKAIHTVEPSFAASIADSCKNAVPPEDRASTETAKNEA